MTYESALSRELNDFVLVTEPYLEQLNDLSIGTAVELYDLLDDAASAATLYIDEIDPELRVNLCDRQDKVLERIVDDLPPFEHTGDPLRVYTPAIYGHKTWKNVKLLKACGLAPYLLAKEINATPVMYFGTKPADYPYLAVLPDMEILYHDSESSLESAYSEYLLKHYSEMDVLLFFGMCMSSIDYLDMYRKLRPDGKVYCGLDMNRWRMENNSWDSASGRQFALQCDIIATSCRRIRDELNRRTDVKFQCRWFTGGFYNPTDVQVTADPLRKENIVLTVSETGMEQQNYEELLIAFAGVTDILNGWSLRLAGPIEPDFQAYIDSYFSQYPKLKEKVIFTGPVADKQELYNEYARAKIFALTSWSERGTPDIYSEALFHGCKFISSDIDAADDIINYGELGIKYNRTDIEALKAALVKICSSADKRGMQTHVPKALAYAKRYYDWERNAKKLAYMLFK